mgnify:CR=1 FL=1
MGLEGFVATLQKKAYRNSLEQLFEVLQQDIPEQGFDSFDQGKGAPIPVVTVDNSGAATASLVLGIVSIVGVLIIPLIGVLCGALGFSRARMGNGSSKSNLATAGKILSIIGVVISIANLVLGFMILL